MARLIDTSVFIAMERMQKPLSELARSLDGDLVAIASITASELLVGYHRSQGTFRRKQKLEFIEIVLLEFDVIPFDLDVARVHAELGAELRTAGQTIGPHDLIIAATAVAFGFDILTLNVRHFDRVPGLQVDLPTW